MTCYVDCLYQYVGEKIKPRGLASQTSTCDGRDSQEKADLPAKTVVRK